MENVKRHNKCNVFKACLASLKKFTYFLVMIFFQLFSFITLAHSENFVGVNPEDSDKNYAFLVFNSTYSEGINLVPNAAETKKDVMSLVKGLAVPEDNTIVLDNPNPSDLEDAVYELSKKLDRKSNLLIYYHGHSTSFVDALENELLMTSFELPRSNDLFLLERRVSRGTTNLGTMVEDFLPKRVGQITVFYDACSTHFISRDEDPEHWRVFNKDICTVQSIDGANVFYSGKNTGQATLSKALIDILSKNATIDLKSLEEALVASPVVDEAQKTADFKNIILASGSRRAEPNTLCIRYHVVDGEFKCNVPLEIEKDKDTSKGEEPEVAPEKNEVASKESKEAENTKEPEVKKSKVKSAKSTAVKRAALRNDWNEVKKLGSCIAYQRFALKYSGSVFKVKAESSISRLGCEPLSEAEIAALQKEIDSEAENENLAVIDRPKLSRSGAGVLGAQEIDDLQREVMRSDWNEAKSAGTCELFQTFVVKYPRSVFKAKALGAISNIGCTPLSSAKIAEVKKQSSDVLARLVEEKKAKVAAEEAKKIEIAKAKAAPKPKEEPLDEKAQAELEAKKRKREERRVMNKAWNSAKRTSSCTSYQKFFVTYPSSAFAPKAQKALTTMGCEIPEPKVVEEPKTEATVIAANTDEGEKVIKDEVATLDEPSKAETDIPKTNVSDNKNEDDIEVAIVDPKPETPITKPVEKKVEPEIDDGIGTSKNSAFTDWNIARKLDTCEAYQAFKANHPRSLFLLKVNSEIKRLCVEETPVVAEEKQETIDEEKASEPVVITAEENTPDNLNPKIETQPETQEIASVEQDATGVDDDVDNTAVSIGVIRTIKTSNVADAWRITRNYNDCFGYLQFAESHANSLFSTKAEQSANRFCNDEQRQAFLNLAEEPEEAQIELASINPEPDLEITETGNVDLKIESPENNFAFIIVNDTYDAGNLGTAQGVKSDQIAVMSVVENLSIPKENLRVISNAGKDELEEAIFDFALKMNSNSNLFLYYSGFGITGLASGINSILPADFVVPDHKQIRLSRRRFNENTIPLKTIIKDLSQREPAYVSVVYNACTTQALPPEKDAPYWVFLKQLPCTASEIEGASIFYPSKTGQIALANLGEGDEDGRSLFMRVFERTLLKNPSINMRALQNELEWSVASLARQNPNATLPQEPVLMHGYSADHKNEAQRCFVKIPVGGKMSCTGVEGDTSEIELAKAEVQSASINVEGGLPTTVDQASAFDKWIETRNLDTCEAYQEFQASFPNSIYSLKAENKIASKCKIEDEVVVTTEEDIEQPFAQQIAAGVCLPANAGNSLVGLTNTGFRQLQTELNRLGCNVGAPDGVWGGNSQRGFDRFIGLSNLTDDAARPGCLALEELKKLPTRRVCPAPAPRVANTAPAEPSTNIRNTTTQPTGLTLLPKQPAKAAPAQPTQATKPKTVAKPKTETKPKTVAKPAATTTSNRTAEVKKCGKAQELKNGKCVTKKGLLGAFR